MKTSRRGFTLVEMLVSVALVVMMMALFAQVFQSATGAMNTQKGISNNDQRSRSAMTIIRNDIRMRTFRDIVPFAPNHSTVPLAATGVLENRIGYWEIDEGDPADPTDDILQFTILTTIPKKLDPSKVEQPVNVGRATMLKPSGDAAADYDTAAKREAKLRVHPNQPVFDNGQTTPDDTGLSEAAEVCYFLRDNILYRRVLLIRQPYETTPVFNEASAAILPPGEDYSTSHVAGYVPSGVAGTGTFWNDFDYSAFYRLSSSGSSKGPVFHDWSVSQENVNPASVTVSVPSATYPLSLGVPHLRFGHSISRGDGTPLSTIGDGSLMYPNAYIGRFTQQETAHSGFSYPGKIPAAGDPHLDTSADVFTLNTTGAITQFANSANRRGEDIIMKNVLEFDIKVLDDNLADPKFVNLGNGNPAGHYGVANGSSNYGNRYDTWHPALGTSFVPPYRPANTGADGANGAIGVDDDLDGTPDNATELGYPGTDDVLFPLKAIQITIRFLDPTSQQTRQLTIVESLVDH